MTALLKTLTKIGNHYISDHFLLFPKEPYVLFELDSLVVTT